MPPAEVRDTRDVVRAKHAATTSIRIDHVPLDVAVRLQALVRLRKTTRNALLLDLIRRELDRQ